jgi:microcystin-dependent protein
MMQAECVRRLSAPVPHGISIGRLSFLAPSRIIWILPADTVTCRIRPNTSSIPTGQAISRTTYATLFSLVGTTFGVGDGSTTFNLPDKRGRVSAGVDTMGGVAAGVLTDAASGFGDSLGEKGGAQSHTLTATEMPTHTHSVTDPGHTHSISESQGSSTTVGGLLYRGSVNLGNFSIAVASATTGISLANAGSGGRMGTSSRRLSATTS